MDATKQPVDIYQTMVNHRDQAKTKLETMLARGGHSPADLKEARSAYNWYRVQLDELDESIAFRLEQEGIVEPAESEIPTIPAPPSDELLDLCIPESARVFVLRDVHPSRVSA